ncbi:hypothetical protein KR074_005544 [Drosophila pseudoananassae]|nr:hypothetical protein KR074_005544 [Drosophila pseudoananassae]
MVLKPNTLLILTVVLLNTGPGLMATSGTKTNDYYCSVVDADVKQMGHYRNAVSQNLIWPSKTLYYNIDPSFSNEERTVVNKSLEAINECTCLTFVEIDESVTGLPNISYIPNQMGSFTLVGFNGYTKPHTVGLDDFGRKNSTAVLHETFHVLGIHHEQSRHDRDKYVYIAEENVPRDKMINFQKHNNTTSFEMDYDYKSFMHYPKNAFAHPNKTSIYRCENGSIVEDDFGSPKPTRSDWIKLNLLYNCEKEIPYECQ